jgi:lysylphosphatidylglycerol synthetase-like protein (DUF2156 family)
MRKTLLAAILLATGLLLSAAPVLAAPATAPAAGQSAISGLELTGKRAGYTVGEASSLGNVVGNLLNALLGLLGIVLVVFLVYGGIKYMTAQGVEKQVIEAKQIMLNAVIGLVIVVSAYAISTFVINVLSGSDLSDAEYQQYKTEFCSDAANANDPVCLP